MKTMENRERGNAGQHPGVAMTSLARTKQRELVASLHRLPESVTKCNQLNSEMLQSVTNSNWLKFTAPL